MRNSLRPASRIDQTFDSASIFCCANARRHFWILFSAGMRIKNMTRRFVIIRQISYAISLKAKQSIKLDIYV